MTTARVLMLGACMMLSQVAISLVRPMTSYRLLELGQSAAVVGWITAVYALAPLFLALPLGRLGGRHATPLAVVGCALLAVGCLVLGFGVDLWHLVVGNVALGAGNLSQMIAYQSIIAHESAQHDLDRNYGWFRAGASVGQLLGPLLGTMAFVRFGSGLVATQIAILIGATAALGGLISTTMLMRGSSRRGARDPSGGPLPKGLVMSTLGRPSAKASMYVSLVGLAALDLLQVYLPVLGEERGVSPTMVGMLLAVRAAASFLARIGLGWLVARYTRRTILLATVGMSAVMMAMVPAVTAPAALIVTMALLGLGLGTGQPVGLAWSVAVVEPHERSTAIALRLMGNRLGQVVVPSVSSLLVALTGTASVFLLISVMLGSSTAAVAATHDHREQ